MKRLQAAEQIRRVLQLLAAGLGEKEALEVPAVYERYAAGKKYQAGEYFTYGENGVGDPQLYRVVQAHTSEEGWRPDTTPALYTAIGRTEDGLAVWSQPAGAHDAYSKGDRVEHGGKRWESQCDNNVWEPGEYGWKEEEDG